MPTISKIVVSSAVVLVASLGALAQEATGAQPPAPTVPTPPSTWIYIVVAALLTAGVVFLSIMPSKRSQNQE